MAWLKRLTILLAMGLPLLAAAHRYFFGMVEISVNDHTGNTEIIHQYALHDVQLAMTQKYQKDFRLDQPDAREKIHKWVNENFSVQDADGNNIDLSWVGMEADYQNIWIYQEVLGKQDPCGWQVRNRLLMNAFPPQVNNVDYAAPSYHGTVALTNQKDSATLTCYTGKQQKQ